jgi:hypothetical protein
MEEPEGVIGVGLLIACGIYQLAQSVCELLHWLVY